MKIFTGHSVNSQNMRDIIEPITLQEFSDDDFVKQIKTYVKGGNGYQNWLIKILTNNKNLIYSLIYCYSTTAEYLNRPNYKNLRAKTFDTIEDELKRYKEDFYIIDWNQTTYADCIRISLIPIESLILPEAAQAQVRKLYIDRILEDLC